MDKLDLIYDMVKNVDKSVEKMHEDQDVILLEVRKNTGDLKEHMRRTEIAETRIRIIEEKMTLKAVGKLIVGMAAGMSTIAGLVYTISKIMGM